MMRLIASRRAAGGWGIAFVVLLFVSAAMASLPTTADPDATITAFYRDHGAVVVAQQVLGAIALVPLVLFALSLDLNRWLRPALFVFVAVELVTNLVPLLILAAPGAAHPLTVAEDLADSALFACVALLVIVLTLGEPLWVRTPAYVVAVACAARAVAGLFGITALDQVAPLAFIGFVLLFCVRLLVTGAPIAAQHPAR